MAGAPQQGQSDNSTSLLWGVAALFLFLYGIWYYFHKQIVTGYFSLKLAEVNLLNTITGNKYEMLHTQVQSALYRAGTATFSDIASIGTSVGDVIRFPFIVFLFLLTLAVYFGNTTRIFRNNYSMKTLSELEAPSWPQILPVMGLDLVKTDIDKGPWAMAMTPMQFCKRNNLLLEVRPERQQGMARSEWDRIDVVLKRGEATRLFIMQLGPIWRGPDRLPPYARALFAAFAARVNADSAGSKLLLQLAASSRGKLNFNGVDALLNKHYKTKLIQKLVKSHAYVFTMMAAMLEAARDDGVQASADFLWLKPLDRRLWYTLNTVGRATPFIEVAGIYAHWVAEKEAEKRLIVPMVEEATNAIEQALKETVYLRDEE